MRHCRCITQKPHVAQLGGIGGGGGNTSLVESVILTLLTVFFQGWDNFQEVITNLQKFYSKTPE